MDLEGTPLNDTIVGIQDLDRTIPNSTNLITGNIVKNSYGTISLDPNAGISPIMAKELQRIRGTISSIPGMIQLISKASPNTHRISRFSNAIVGFYVNYQAYNNYMGSVNTKQ